VSSFRIVGELAYYTSKELATWDFITHHLNGTEAEICKVLKDHMSLRRVVHLLKRALDDPIAMCDFLNALNMGPKFLMKKETQIIKKYKKNNMWSKNDEEARRRLLKKK
jgi:hypothetical protein